MNNNILFRILKEISNRTKFRIIELTQDSPKNISEISKATKIAYNKCSNYCPQLAALNIVEKTKVGKNVLIKSRINLASLDKCLVRR